MVFYDDTEDYMVAGESNLIPIGENRWLHKDTGHIIDENGDIFNADGELIESDYYQERNENE